MDGSYLKEELYQLFQKEPKIVEFIQSGALDGMWYWDLEHMEYEWMSPKFWEALGYDPRAKQHLSSEWQDIIFPEDLTVAKENLSKHWSNPDYPFDQIVRYHHKDGSTVWIRCRGIAIRNKEGIPVRMLGSHVDITALKKAEEEIQKISDEYEMVFHGTQDAIFLVDVDTDKKFTYRRLNQSHENSTGLTTAAIVGKSPSDLLGEELGAVVEENYGRCVDCKSPIAYEEELTLTSGTKTWLTMLSPVIKDDRVIKIIGASRDITERKRAQEEIFEEKEKLDIILQAIGDGVISVDTECCITFMNASAEKILEYKREDAKGKKIYEILNLYRGNDRLELRDDLDRIISSELPLEIFENTVLVTGNHTRKRLNGKAVRITDITGKIQGMVITIQDDTEKLKNQEELAYLSLHDSLTGLYNRAYYDAELARLDAGGYLPLSMIVGDVNGLKLSNDVFGHADGDRLLTSIADILKEACRFDDVITRWGGDEFSILLPKTTPEEAKQVCKKIKDRCETYGLVPIKPSIALGTATKIKAEQSVSKVLADAEEQMYKNKLLEGKKVRSEIIAALLTILEERSNETIEHCSRLQELAGKIVQDFGLTEREKEHLRIFANLHDIGNISVPKDILLKEEKLKTEDWYEIKKHPEIGYRIAQSSVELVPIADFILTHHERWDGTGYPQGLSGEKIPKLSRILTLMDTYDTMTHSKPYKKARSHEQAIEEIIRCSGTQFDPELTDIFIKTINRLHKEN